MDMGREEESVRCMERVTRKLTSQYVKQIANGNLLYGDGREVQKEGDICIPMAGFMLRFDRKQQNSIKQLSFKKTIN